MNVNTTAVISQSAVVPQISHQLLYRGNVIINTYRCHKFDGVSGTCFISISVDTINACVLYYLPCSTDVITDTVRVITAAGMIIACTEIVRDDLCRSFSCKPRELYFDSKLLVLYRIISPPEERAADLSTALSEIFIFHPQTRTAQPYAAERSRRDSTVRYRTCINTLRAAGI